MKTIKTLLIHPNHKDWARKLPLGIAYLAAYLRAHNRPVKILDLCVEPFAVEEILEIINRNNINLVGITATTPQIYKAWELAEEIKKRNSGIIIVLGGAHVSALPEESLEKNFVDFVVVGEGEETLLELVKALEKGGGLDAIKGIGYKLQNKMKINEPRDFINDLDSLPYPARDLFRFPEGYASPGQYYKFFADILTSRGCPAACTFCANKLTLGRAFRARTPENVIKEIKYLVKNYNIKEIHISDDNFTLDRERAIQICRLIKENGIKIKWACGNGVKVSTIDKELVGHMKEAGCYRVGVGIETGNREVLKKLGKGITLEEAKSAVNLFKKYKIITVGFFMLGNIGEDEETMKDTIKFAKNLNLDYAQFTIMTPFPGSPVFKYLQQNNYLLSKDWREYGLFNKPVFKTDKIDEKILLKMYSAAYREFYFRSSLIFRRIYGAATNYYEFKIIFGGLKQIISRIFIPKRKFDSA